LTVNGKVDKRALPGVDLDVLRVEYVAPTNGTERDIVKAFEIAFNQSGIGIYDDFVRLGGDSLTAIKIVSLLPFDISVNTILNSRTPYKIAQSINENNNEYKFDLVKKGVKNQNMFILPPNGGVSFIFTELIDAIDFEGNIYLIDDFKFDLSLDELKNIENPHILTLNHYYDAIEDIFQDGDIIAGYSLGCIYASLIAEKLEQNKKIDKCILIDGTLKFVNKEKQSKKEIMDDLINNYDEEKYKSFFDEYASDFKDKFLEICYINSSWDFDTPKIKSHIIYLSTSDSFNEDLDYISDNYEFISIDSTHKDIIEKDVDKIKKYFN